MWVSSCFVWREYYLIAPPYKGVVMRDNEIPDLHKDNQQKEVASQLK